MSVLSFGLIQLVPGNPAEVAAGDSATPERAVAAVTAVVAGDALTPS